MVPAALMVTPEEMTGAALLVKAAAPPLSTRVPPLMKPSFTASEAKLFAPLRVRIPVPFMVSVVPLVMAVLKVVSPPPVTVSPIELAFTVPPKVSVPALLVIVPGVVTKVTLEFTALALLLVRAVAPALSVMVPPAMMPSLVIRSVKALVPASVRVPTPDLVSVVPLLMALAKVTLPSPEESSACEPALKVPVKFNEDAAFVTRIPPPAPSVTLAEIVAAPVVLTAPSNVKALPPIE